MNIEIKNIKTGELTFACLNNSTEKEVKDFISFYKNIKQNGCKKYEVKSYM